jgi:type II secretory pathway component PulM
VLAWFQRFNQREQAYLLAAAFAVLLYLLYVGVWRPVDDRREAMAAQNQRMAESVERVRVMAGELKQLKASGGTTRRRNLNQLINTTTADLSLRPSRIQPNSRGETQVRFEDVGFAGLLRWLHQLEYVEEVPVLEVSINQGDRSGLVNASVRLGAGG